MIGEKAGEITVSPRSYGDWLDCFAVLRTKNVTKEELRLLSMGECAASADAVEYLETQLVKTVNVMMRRYIQSFNRELELHLMYNEYENVYRLFASLAGKFSGCLFFMPLQFMSLSFREELRDSVVQETKRFWQLMLDAMYRQCIEQNNTFLEDELYMIKRIKLFV